MWIPKLLDYSITGKEINYNIICLLFPLCVTMANSDVELSKMVRDLRVSELQTLLSYAGRKKAGKKYDLQARALLLLKLGLPEIAMKVRELHNNRYNQAESHAESPEMYSMTNMNDAVMGYGSYSSHQRLGSVPAIPGFVPAMEVPMVDPTSLLNVLPQYPVHPEVQFKELPFYKVLTELMKPISLITLPNSHAQNKDFQFCLTPQHVSEFQCSLFTQVQLRICLLDTSCEQEDELPSKLSMRINQIECSVPRIIPTNKAGLEPKRLKCPIDITNVTKKTATEPNKVQITWASAAGKPYVLGVFLVKKQTSTTLIKKLKANGVRNPDHTTAMIKEKLLLDRDSEIATMSLRGSLMCPLGKIKMNLPCRALTCKHLQCFDATLYLQMNEKKPKWNCPVCDKPALFKNLAIDGLFLDIVSKAPSECTEVQFHENGSWTPVMPVKKQTEINEVSFEPPPKDVPKVEVAKPKRPIEVISLDSDGDAEDSWPVLPPKKKMIKSSKVMSPVLLELSEESQNSVDTSLKSFDPFAPCSSKTETNLNKILPILPDKNILFPLPDSLDIDTTDVDSMARTTSSILGVPSSSNFDSVSVVSSTKSVSPPSVCKLAEPDTLPTQNSSKNFNEFDFFSLIQTNQEESFIPPVKEVEESPDIINID